MDSVDARRDAQDFAELSTTSCAPSVKTRMISASCAPAHPGQGWRSRSWWRRRSRDGPIADLNFVWRFVNSVAGSPRVERHRFVEALAKSDDFGRKDAYGEAPEA
jgi:hypothetical protein